MEREWCLTQAEKVFEAYGGKPVSGLSFRMALKDALGPRKAFQMSSQKATDIGTMLHERIEWELRSEMGVGGLKEPRIPESTVDAGGQVVQHPAHHAHGEYRAWRKEHQFRPILLEQMIWSDKYKFAGTMDVFCEYDGKLTVADWKSSKAIYPESAVQVSSYRQGWIEMGQAEAPLHGLVVRLPKEAGDTFEHKDVPWEWHENAIWLIRALHYVYEWHQAQEAARG